MRYLTVEECRRFGGPGDQNEVTPVLYDGVVKEVIIYNKHISGWREGRRKSHGSSLYGNLVAAIDKDGV